jgi:hypothetical protein
MREHTSLVDGEVDSGTKVVGSLGQVEGSQ